MKLTAITDTAMTPGHKTVQYTYDAKGRLQTAAYANGATTGYGYDNRGNRLRRTSRVQGQTSLGYDAFSFGGAMSQPVTHYYHPNHRGDTAYLTDASGVTAASYVYDAFGCLLAQSGIRHPASGICFCFSGKECEPDAQLYYFGYRWYDPDTGTWTTKDPLGFLACDHNLYRMVFNNVESFVDSHGLWTVQLGFSGTGGGGIGATAGFGVAFGHSKECGWQFDFYTVEGGGAYAGAGGSVTFDISWSNNACLNDISGPGWTVGGSGGEAISLGGEATIPLAGKDAGSIKAAVTTVSIGFGAGTPGEGHSFVTHTQLH